MKNGVFIQCHNIVVQWLPRIHRKYLAINHPPTQLTYNWIDSILKDSYYRVFRNTWHTLLMAVQLGTMYPYLLVLFWRTMYLVDSNKEAYQQVKLGNIPIILFIHCNKPILVWRYGDHVQYWMVLGLLMSVVALQWLTSHDLC